jgi:membrane carboxypeptidase/penicillin-binding protein
MLNLIRRFAAIALAHSWAELDLIIRARWMVLASGIRPMPPTIALQLLISGEDRRNGRHPGIDLLAVVRAIWRTVICRKPEGASTIEQQLVRVLTGRFERTVKRKCCEMLLAILVANAFEKRVTASVYLDAAYYGWRMTGYDQACRRLKVSPFYLSTSAAAAIIARLKYPEPSAMPKKRVEQIERRRLYLLRLYQIHRIDGTYSHIEVENVNQTLYASSKPQGCFLPFPATK